MEPTNKKIFIETFVSFLVRWCVRAWYSAVIIVFLAGCFTCYTYLWATYKGYIWEMTITPVGKGK